MRIAMKVCAKMQERSRDMCNVYLVHLDPKFRVEAEDPRKITKGRTLFKAGNGWKLTWYSGGEWSTSARWIGMPSLRELGIYRHDPLHEGALWCWGAYKSGLPEAKQLIYEFNREHYANSDLDINEVWEDR
jgi:hypothetical protein